MIKMAIDIILSIFLLILLFPVLIIISSLNWLFLGNPILFVQERIGLLEKPFKLIKFRTMKHVEDDSGKLLPDEERLSEYGKFLRKLSLDELPSLLNVIKGDMSLVGPRPLLPEYIPFYTAEQRRRHTVKPGITGWAQINGRNSISWEEKFDLDIWYVKNKSLAVDIYIIFKTISKVIKAKNISYQNHVTMLRFDERKEK